ncbi:MAG: addiction module toxin, HicA family [Nitrospinae bacterium]|nr:addiction module toxin, HicA family [Nitrospinota bacterium]
MNTKEILRILKREGWKEIRRKGSHVQLKHEDKPGLVTVPHPKRDLPAGTLRSIERQSGLRLRSR